MSLWRIAWGYLWARRLTTSLTILSVALGVGLIYSVLTLREETRKRFEEEGMTWDVVVGPQGSPLQLTLSAVYFMDLPPGKIKLADYEAVKKMQDVKVAFPLCMGDTYRQSRIVGTIPELMSHSWENPNNGEIRPLFKVVEGRCFEKAMEAVLGASVAEQHGLKVGDTFTGAHGIGGHEHEEHPYTVVGILAPSGSPSDRAIFCSMDSVWDVHTHDGDDDDRSGHEPSESISAILVETHSPADRFEITALINDPNSPIKAMATRPIEQIAKLFESLLGMAKSVLLAVGYLVVVISAISILIGLYLSILQRKRDLAIMRALGASAFEIVGSVLIEAFLVTALGIAAGYLVGNAVAWGVGVYLAQNYGLTIRIFQLPTVEERAAFAVVGLVGMLAGIAPAWQAYRTDVARDLAEL